MENQEGKKNIEQHVKFVFNMNQKEVELLRKRLCTSYFECNFINFVLNLVMFKRNGYMFVARLHQIYGSG